MKRPSARRIGEDLAKAARLSARPLCTYGSEVAPAGAVPSTSISSCVAEAVVALAVRSDTPAIYIGGDSLDDCCGGGTSYLGFTRSSPFVKYFVSYGTKEYRGGAAEYLRASPDIMEENEARIGRITPPGKYVVVKPCASLSDGDPEPLSILLFGEPEQIRILCALVHFRSLDPFEEILAPSGPSCASFITYASGMAEKTPKNSAILGPFDPTGNTWFPPEFMSFALPMALARRVHDDLPSSFLTKRTAVAFPKRRRPAR